MNHEETKKVTIGYNKGDRREQLIGRYFLQIIFISMLWCLLVPCEALASVIKVDSLGKVSLNGVWKFKADLYNAGEHEAWYGKDFEAAGWDTMQVPGNWDVRNEYSDYAGKAWYRKDFSVRSDWESKNVRIFFESVYNESKVWINGKQIGQNQLGFLPFFFDVNQYLHFGETNTITVLVDNTFKRGAMWNWGGIRRPVWLEITDKSRFEYQHITALPDFEKGIATIDLAFEVGNLDSIADSLQYTWEILKEGKIIWKQNTKTHLAVQAKGTESGKFSTHFPLSKVALWHFNHPHLYTSILRLYRKGKEIHALTDRFGIRKIEIEGERVKLNGEVIRTVGFNIVADDRTNGSTLPLWRVMEDVDLMKSLGANMARLSHQPLPKEFLDYLDEKGIMTFEEVALWGKDIMVDPDHPIPKEWLSKMIKYKYNHPSIMGWSVGNEIGFMRDNPKVMEYVAGAIVQAKQEDPSRMAVYVTHSADAQRTDPAMFSDMIMLNKYGNWGESAEKTHKHQSGKPIFYSEYGSKITDEDPNLGEIDAEVPLREMRDKAYLMGASLWTFNDYRSAFPGTPLSQNRSWGIVDVFRQKKRAYHSFRKAYAPIKALELQGTTAVSITPRGILDIPAYRMKDYQLVWEAHDMEGKLIDGGFSDLPEIKPGDGPFSRKLTWKQAANTYSTVKISVIDPQGYAVYDTINYLIRPKQPNIVSTHSEAKKIRVVFDKTPLASAWKVRYTANDVVTETEETINNFIDIKNLSMGNTYKIQLIAVNSAGESVPSTPVSVSTSERELPPIIWNTESADKGFFIGYSVYEGDYLYQVQYGTTSGEYENFHTIQLRTAGVCHVPGLTNGQTYYFRMRRLMQWGFASDWTHELAVTPGNAAKAPRKLGVLKNGKEALLIFQPVKKAIGYRVKYTDKKSGQIGLLDVNAAQIGYIRIEGLSARSNYDFEIAGVMPEGL